MKQLTTPQRILFVCLGNICRSPAAEGMMRSLAQQRGFDLTLDSAGTGRWHIGQLPDPRMRKAARARGLELNHRCRVVSYSDFDEFDLIIGMDSQNMADLRQLAPTTEAERRIFPMAQWLPKGCCYDYIPDPYYEGVEGFELVLDLLEDACSHLLDEIQSGALKL